MLGRDDWDGLAATLNSLAATSMEGYRRMSEAGRRRYEQCYVFEIFRENYLKLLSEL